MVRREDHQVVVGAYLPLHRLEELLQQAVGVQRDLVYLP